MADDTNTSSSDNTPFSIPRILRILKKRKKKMNEEDLMDQINAATGKKKKKRDEWSNG